jgi:NAD(P)-dependent dehydrogenase (short-subunit alcohol dehydrogenase family)
MVGHLTSLVSVSGGDGLGSAITSNDMSSVVLITGAGGGIGRASALRFARAGWTVVATDISDETLEITARALTATGARCVSIIMDVCNSESVRNGVLAILKTRCRLAMTRRLMIPRN